jgi:steroid 5-alpha reductase family enzyme
MSVRSSSSNSSNSNFCIEDLWRLTVNELLGLSSYGHNNDNNNYDDDDDDDRSTTTTIATIITNPIQLCCLTCTVFIGLVFVVSQVTRNYSQVDKLWSITPIVYAWILVVDGRTVVMAILVTGWGIRLTYNFHRRGGYKWPPWTGDEDYRWRYIQDGFFLPILQNKILWMVFNLGFISIYQNLILLLIVAPSIIAYLVATKCTGGDSSGSGSGIGSTNTWPYYHDLSSLNEMDFMATILFIFFLVIESIADNQQQRFQEEKHRRRQLAAAGADTTKDGPSSSASSILLVGEYADGFKRSGLFAIVRKPNYASEQAIWISYYLFSIAATISSLTRTTANTTNTDTNTNTTEESLSLWIVLPLLFNWSSIGWILLCILFQISGWFTEKITLSKYPIKYRQYMEDTPLYVPNLYRWMTTTTMMMRRRKNNNDTPTNTNGKTKKVQ